MSSYLTRRQVQEYAECSRSTVERAVELYEKTKGRKGLRAIQRVENGHRKFRLSDVREWSGLDDNVTQLRRTA